MDDLEIGRVVALETDTLAKTIDSVAIGGSEIALGQMRAFRAGEEGLGRSEAFYHGVRRKNKIAEILARATILPAAQDGIALDQRDARGSKRLP